MHGLSPLRILFFLRLSFSAYYKIFKLEENLEGICSNLPLKLALLDSNWCSRLKHLLEFSFMLNNLENMVLVNWIFCFN